MHDFNDEDILKLERNTFRPHFLGVYQFHNSTPLMGTKYVERLSNDGVRQHVAECNWLFFECKMKTDEAAFASIKKCYQDALDDGIYEAANNLGVLAYNFEQKHDEGKAFLQLAIEHGSLNAMINMFTILWVEDATAGIDFLQKNMDTPNPSLRCMFNLAYLYFMGDREKGNILRKDKERALSILTKVAEFEGNPIYAIEKDAIEKAHKFIKHIKGGY